MSIRALAMDAVIKRVISRGGKQDVAAEISRRRAEGSPAPAAVPQSLHKRFDVVEARVEGSPVVTLGCRDAPRGRAVIFLAGGGYAHPISIPSTVCPQCTWSPAAGMCSCRRRWMPTAS